MAKILILGNNPDTWWIKGIKSPEIISVPNISNGRSIDVSNFIHTLPQDADCIVIDADSLDFSNIELPLDLILQIRLMLHECKGSSLSNIVLVTDFSFETYKDYGAKSMVLMTKNVSLVKSENAKYAIENARPMTPAEYVLGFLRLIKIEPAEKVEGRHSIANEWGAKALLNVISSGVKTNIISLKASSSLYFKYSNVAALNAEDISQIIEGKMKRYLTKNLIIPYDIKYLLIDDEASKGWSQVLTSLMPNAVQEVWDSPIDSYDEISKDVRHKIESGEYDLIFLDLRMAGVREDSILKPEEFSGMKILKAIKKINSGIQVIMLTATNKAWNVKALLDAGANGYYMKESPEYHFPLKYTEQNAESFVKTIEDCIRDSYLKDIVSKVSYLQTILPTDSELTYDIINQLSIAQSQILKAKTPDEYAFAYISLEQVFEITAAYLIRLESSQGGISCYFTEDSCERCKLYIEGKDNGFISYSSGKSVPIWMRVSSIYYQLYGGADSTFDSKVKDLINLRNKYIHPGDGKRPTITSEHFSELFERMVEYLSVFK